MAEEILLDSPERWKAVSHPLRLGILKVLQEGDRTNEELADALQVASGKLYFHTKTLLNAGLIELAGTRQKGPLTEKVYRGRVSSFITAPNAEGTGPRNQALLQQALQLYINTWKEFGDFPHAAGHFIHYLTPEDAAEIEEQLHRVMNEFRRRATVDYAPGTRGYAVSMLIHETAPEKAK